MAKQTVEALVEGGKASAAPPLGPALGPLGVNIGQVVAEINKKTADFKGVQVPVKVIVDEDKSFEIEVGTPPASALIKQEAHIQKGSGRPADDYVADIRIEQLIKISKMKGDALSGATPKARVKEIAGTCVSMGVMIEGKPAKESIKDIEEGKYDEPIREGRTELSAEALKELEEKKKKLAQEIEKRQAEYRALATQIIESNKSSSRASIKAKLVDAKIPAKMIEELLPAETKATTKKK
ncbi:50S ribosomal protein L11 [Candidatus Woesearchaeota archaeon]|nr:MAG: 50S ribosomal protein L11 [Candidatus Woesearchaeota archaeon]